MVMYGEMDGGQAVNMVSLIRSSLREMQSGRPATRDVAQGFAM
jgi:hypothetical protein